MWKALLGNKKRTRERGQMFLEALLAVAVVAVSFGVLLQIAFSSLTISREIKNVSEANFLLKGILESARAFRDGTDWNINGVGTAQTSENDPYYFTIDQEQDPAVWILTEGEETVGIFTRKIFFERVSRNASSGDIESVYNPSRDDPDTRKITAIITWENKSERIETYIGNWK